jgi:hypothetical protein
VNSVVNNQVSSPKSSVNKYNISNKVSTGTKLNNNFLLQSTQNVQSTNFNLNEYKNIRRNNKNCSAAIKSISNIPGMGIGDWGLGIGPNPQSPIPNPHYIHYCFI